MKIKLTKAVRDFGGSPFPKGSIFEARDAPDGMLEVVGAQNLPLYPHEWELVLTRISSGCLTGSASAGAAGKGWHPSMTGPVIYTSVDLYCWVQGDCALPQIWRSIW